MEAVSYFPPLPTLWPSMLLGGSHPGLSLPPFNAPAARYFYFCRNAIWLTVKLLRLEGAEVLVPAYHHGVEVEALVDAGAKPVFYRVGSRWDVDLEDVRRRITPRTRALYLIHYAGFPGPTHALRKLADEHGLPLVEDCALSLLSSDGEEPLGSVGDISVFCLYKTLPVPNGGALVMNGPRTYSVPEPPAPPRTSTFSHLLGSLLQNLELRGGAPGRWARRAVRGLGHSTVKAAKVERVSTGTQHFNRAHVDLGMSPLTRRIALAQDFAAIVEARRRNFFYLMGALRGVAPSLVSQLPSGVSPLFYPLVVEDKALVMAQLRSRGIETIDFWRHFHPSCSAADFPEVAQLRRTVLEIPCHQDLTPVAMAQIAAAVRETVAARPKPRA